MTDPPLNCFSHSGLCTMAKAFVATFMRFKVNGNGRRSERASSWHRTPETSASSGWQLSRALLCLADTFLHLSGPSAHVTSSIKFHPAEQTQSPLPERPQSRDRQRFRCVGSLKVL